MCFIDSYERVVNPVIVSCEIMVTKLIFDMVNKKNAKRETNNNARKPHLQWIFFGRPQELSVQPYEKSRASRTNSYNWAGNKLDYRYLVRLGCIYSECQVLNEGRFTIKTINYSNSSAVLKFLKILAQQRY